MTSRCRATTRLPRLAFRDRACTRRSEPNHACLAVPLSDSHRRTQTSLPASPEHAVTQPTGPASTWITSPDPAIADHTATKPPPCLPGHASPRLGESRHAASCHACQNERPASPKKLTQPALLLAVISAYEMAYELPPRSHQTQAATAAPFDTWN
jgi:hypothetical protein